MARYSVKAMTAGQRRCYQRIKNREWYRRHHPDFRTSRSRMPDVGLPVFVPKTPEENRECRRKRKLGYKQPGRKAWLEKNRGKQRSYNQAWKARDPEGYRRSIARRRERQMSKASVRVHKAMRDSIRHALAGTRTEKTLHTMAIVGCSADALKVHLERQFKRGMSWANYGKQWEIDHITPVSYFDLTEPGQLALCFNWQNLRPLTCRQNRREQNRRGHSQLHLPLPR